MDVSPVEYLQSLYPSMKYQDRRISLSIVDSSAKPAGTVRSGGPRAHDRDSEPLGRAEGARDLRGDLAEPAAHSALR